MPLPTNHQELVAEAKRRAEAYNADLEKQRQTDNEFAFAKIGAHIPSEAEKAQLARLEAIQQKANEKIFDSRVRF